MQENATTIPWRHLSRHFLALRWLKVSLVVGSALNLINQHDAIFGNAAPDWAKLLLTYCVPYVVASVSAWNASKGTPGCRNCDTRALPDR